MTAAKDRPEEILQALSFLELPPEATPTEVRQAHRFLRDLYGSESIAMLPISEEMSAEKRRKILDGIEEAYEKLIRFFEAERQKAPGMPGTAPAEVQRVLSQAGTITGEVLKTVREMRGYDLEEAAAETRIPLRHLKSIEAEAYRDLPEPVYTRGFVTGYAGFLEIDAGRTAKDFMDRFERWKKAKDSRAPRRRLRFAFWRKDKKV